MFTGLQLTHFYLPIKAKLNLIKFVKTVKTTLAQEALSIFPIIFYILF